LIVYVRFLNPAQITDDDIFSTGEIGDVSGLDWFLSMSAWLKQQ
jgi:hypothetical protein